MMLVRGKAGGQGRLTRIAEWTPDQARSFAQGIIDAADKISGGHA